MPSEPGSQEPSTKWSDWVIDRPQGVGPVAVLSPAETKALDSGEPYCFNCVRPASSFEAYDAHLEEGVGVVTRADAVREEEGTYNPYTNRFACDGCYIAIGMPAGPAGWLAP